MRPRLRQTAVQKQVVKSAQASWFYDWAAGMPVGYRWRRLRPCPIDALAMPAENAALPLTSVNAGPPPVGHS
jgi:hypothetical protein